MPKHCDNCEMLREYLDGAEEEVVELKAKLKKIKEAVGDLQEMAELDDGFCPSRLDKDELETTLEDIQEPLKALLKEVA